MRLEWCIFQILICSIIITPAYSTPHTLILLLLITYFWHLCIHLWIDRWHKLTVSSSRHSVFSKVTKLQAGMIWGLIPHSGKTLLSSRKHPYQLCPPICHHCVQRKIYLCHLPCHPQTWILVKHGLTRFNPAWFQIIFIYFPLNISPYFLVSFPRSMYQREDRGGTVVKVLCYESEGCWFDSRWCHWNFSLT